MNEPPEDDMPQPLSRVKPDAKLFTEGELPPTLCAHIVRTISAWSHSDQILTTMLAGFLDADFDVVAAMYRALVSSDAKRAAIIGAAKQARPDKALLLQAALNTTRSYRNRRNEFAHHIWATSPQVPDALVLIDPAVLTEHTFAIHRWAKDPDFKVKATHVGKAIKVELPPVPPQDRSRMWVYKEKELKTCGEDAIACNHVFTLLARMCGRTTDDEAQQELLSAPPIRQEFERLTSGSG